jgi:putative DNA primase/helicase
VLFALPELAELTTHKAVWKRDDGMAFNLFELRCGTVQDVLPPSWHPDGHRYEWIRGPWEYESLPWIPADLFDFWHSWAVVKPAIDALSPWYVPPAEPTKTSHRIVAPGSPNDLIGQFNAAHTVEEILGAHGYAQHGKRWLSPSSTTGVAGIVILDDGRAYSHHGSDLLAGDHAHDAFSLYCILAHHGDARAAVRAYAELSDA